MTDEIRVFSCPMSRRSFPGASGAVMAAGALPACSAGGGGGDGGGGKSIKFWDMQWGVTDAYNTDAKAVVTGVEQYGTTACNQTIPRANFNKTFANEITYADNSVADFKKSGLYDDFAAGTWDAMKIPKGHTAVPWNLDAGAVDPGSVSHRVAHYTAKWTEKSIGIGWFGGYLDADLNDVGDILVADPLPGPRSARAGN